jgi:cellulose synthase/poly-beta-1,6-N-acetylglucosamine synthase-like glycosyltransferase
MSDYNWSHKYNLKVPNILVIGLAVFMAYLSVYLINESINQIDSYIIDKFEFETDKKTNILKFLLIKVFDIFLFLNLFPFFLFLLWNIRFNPYKGWLKDKPPLVSIIIPAFNEQNTIIKSIQCAIRQDYPEYEIIVVDDGSSDFTPFLIDFPEVKAIHMVRNQGKASAVNQAIAEAKGDYILFSDSDSHLHKNAIRELVKHFDSPNVGAVCGKLIVRNIKSLIVCWQSIEYIFSQAIVKIAQNGSGASVLVCPGPICMYERKTLIEIG